MRLFKPRACKEKNYRQYEVDLYINLMTLAKMAEEDELEKKYYSIPVNSPVYRKCFDISYSLIRFYTLNKDINKEYQFKRNYLLSKTRGLFSNQKKKETHLVTTYLVKKEQLDMLPNDYFKMFKIEKQYEDMNKSKS